MLKFKIFQKKKTLSHVKLNKKVKRQIWKWLEITLSYFMATTKLKKKSKKKERKKEDSFSKEKY